MTSFIRFSPIVALALVVACATPKPRILGFSLSEESFGIYEAHDGQTILLEKTESIPCRLGTTFGVTVALQLSSNSGGRVPLGGEVRSPPVEGIRLALVQILPDPLIAPEGAVGSSIEAIYTFDDDRKLVAGDYSLRLYETTTQATRYERTFHLTGCP